MSPCFRARSLLILVVLCILMPTTRVLAADSGEPERTAVAVLAAEARFQTNAAELTSGGQAGLSTLIDALEDFEQILSIRVVGHTDSVGAADYNRRLSAQRALTISRLVQTRLPGVQIVAVGAGEATPVATNATAAGRKRNRRVELHVVATGVKPESG